MQPHASPRSTLLAVGLQLTGRQVLVVGAGPVGEAKIARLLACGAKVRVVAPVATAQVRDWAETNRIDWYSRPFVARDLDGCLLAITATGTPVDMEVFEACDARQMLCNAADVPEACSVYLMSQGDHGTVTVAVGTSGLAPGLAGRLRREAEAGLPDDIDDLVICYASLRRWLVDVHAPGPQSRRRGEVLRWLAAQPWPVLRRPLEELRGLLADQFAMTGSNDAMTP